MFGEADTTSEVRLQPALRSSHSGEARSVRGASLRGTVSERHPEISDVSRRTWLAAERTWLAWWRSGVGVGAVAIAVGRFLPGLTHGARWPFRVLGIGYGLLSVVVLLAGANRQRRARAALRRGEHEELASQLVAWLTALAVILGVGATMLVVVAF